MASFLVYPGIAPHSEELFFDQMRVKQIFTKFPHEVELHSLYECTERSEHTEETKCPFTVTVRCGRKNRVKYIRNAYHNHNTHTGALFSDAWFRSVLYDAVQSADPDKDLKDLLFPVSQRLSLRRTKSELEDIYEALEWQRRAARVRGSVEKWNCIPLGIPKGNDGSGVPEERAVLKIDGSVASHLGVVEHLAPVEELPSAALAISVYVAPGPVKKHHPTIPSVALTRARYIRHMYNRQMELNLTYIERRRVLKELVHPEK